MTSKEPTPIPEGMTRENRPKASVAPSWGSLTDYPSLADIKLQDLKLQQTKDYALSVIENNRECFVAQWVLQNQDKNLDDYVLCYCYSGDVIKFWVSPKVGEINES